MPGFFGENRMQIEDVIEKITQIIEKSTGLSREVIDSHSFWELEEKLSIPHYRMSHAYDYVTLKCGCRVPVKRHYRGDW